MGGTHAGTGRADVVAVFRAEATVTELEQPWRWRVERLTGGAVRVIPVVAIWMREVLHLYGPLLVIQALCVS